MKPNHVLIVGGIITVILVILWYFEVISEPMAALGSAVLTLIGFMMSNNSDNGNKGNKTKINVTQKHSGTGDNVGRDKITK